VLYHRWQVDGRKEAPSSIHDREPALMELVAATTPWVIESIRNSRRISTNVREACHPWPRWADEDTIIVQMVAFSDIPGNLDRYLQAMDNAGLSEVFLPLLRGKQDGRLWRTVPGRRWYSDQRGETPGSQEVVLIHRRRNGSTSRSLESVRVSVSDKSSSPSDVSESMNGANALCYRIDSILDFSLLLILQEGQLYPYLVRVMRGQSKHCRT